MKIITALCLCLCFSQARAGENGKGRISPELAVAVTKAVTMPAVHAATSAVRAAADGARAAGKAYAGLFRQVRERFPERRAPDLALVRVCMKLTMRINNGSLKTLSGYKAYPSEKDFERFAAAGRAGIKGFSDGLAKRHTWSELDNKRVQDIIALELKKGIARLPRYAGPGVPAAPEPSPEELEYLAGGD